MSHAILAGNFQQDLNDEHKIAHIENNFWKSKALTHTFKHHVRVCAPYYGIKFNIMPKATEVFEMECLLGFDK